MALTLLYLFVGLALLLGGGDFLVRGASSLARSLGVRPIVIGLTVVAFGTSAPELVVNLFAAGKGQGGMAFGNVVGSNLANLGLILGTAALVKPLTVQGTVILREIPMMLLATATVAVMALQADLTGVDGTLERTEGLTLLLFFGVFLYAMLVDVLRDRPRDPLARQAVEFTEVVAPPRRRQAIAAVVGGLAGLLVGGQLLVDSASELARGFGVPESVIGLSIVAVGTSLPELVTSAIAARRGEADMAIGNVVGSNIFNLLLVLGLTTSIAPLAVPAGGFVDVAFVLAASLLLLPFSLSDQRRLVRWEGGVLVAAWAGYNAWRYAGTL